MRDYKCTHYGRGRPHGHHLDRRTARVPKGFLRHYVLKLLDEQAMSGSEIMNTISERTENKWEPSPGSVYPLLSWLLDSGYTNIVEDQEVGIKRYRLTDEGKKFLAEHDERNPDFDQRISNFDIRFRGDLSKLPQDVQDIFRDFRKLRRSGWKLFKRLKRDYSEEVAKQAKVALNEFIEKLEKLSEMDESKD
jgi:DNA-binding PadR family transcriptional regulator